ncbi:unnamed protein product [Penicillium pancosmium]
MEQTNKHALLNACTTGNLETLQSHFLSQNIQPGSKVLWRETDQSPPPTWTLLTAAINHDQATVVSYLLSIYTVGDISCEQIASAIIHHPNLEIMQFLYSHSPDIVNLEMDPHRTFLTEACRGPQGSVSSDSKQESALLLLHFLLDHGADPREGGLGASGALLPALESAQPLEIIEKILRMERADALRSFFGKGLFSSVLSSGKMLEIARESKDAEMISLVEEGCLEMEKSQQGTDVNTETGRSKRWWKFGGRTDW